MATNSSGYLDGPVYRDFSPLIEPLNPSSKAQYAAGTTQTDGDCEADTTQTDVDCSTQTDADCELGTTQTDVDCSTQTNGDCEADTTQTDDDCSTQTDGDCATPQDIHVGNIGTTQTDDGCERVHASAFPGSPVQSWQDPPRFH